ncbi:MAG: hypothetical protein WC676_04775 [Candidatus Omnitrophota bacterium]
MRFSKFLLLMCSVTILSLVYIRLQVDIFDLAYQGKNKEIEIQKLLDHRSNALSSISTLKSSSHLGVKLLADNSGMRFLDNDHVVELRAPVVLANQGKKIASTRSENKMNFLAGLFTLKSQAQAESIK